MRPNYFPVIKEECQTQQSNGELINANEINVAWLGRLDGDKIQSLIYFVENAFDSIDNLKMNVHLIGNGNKKDVLGFNKYAGHVRFIFNSALYGETRDQYLVDNADLVIAMGISAIDAAKLAIPTIVPIISTQKIREDKFVYLYDIKNYSLGWESDVLQKLGCTTHTARDIICDVCLNNRKAEIGLKCGSFVNSEFSINKHLTSGKNLLLSTELTVNKCLQNETVSKQFFALRMYRRFINKTGTYAQFLEFNEKVKSFRKMKVAQQIRRLTAWGIRRLKGGKK